MSIKLSDEWIYIVIKIAKAAPKSRVYMFLFIILKYIPYILITHDFNINSQMGISYFIRMLILGDLFYEINQRVITFIIVMIWFIFGVITLISVICLMSEGKKFGKLSLYQKRYLSIIANLNFIFCLFDQFLYSILTESVFCRPSEESDTNDDHFITIKKNSCYDYLYYFQIVIGIIIMLYSLFISVFINAIISFPYFNSNGLITTSLKMIDIRFIICSLLQIPIQLEYHLSLNTILIIKHVIRIFILIDQCLLFYTHRWFYILYSYEYGMLLLKTVCIISILIEWIFYFDINNSLLILQNNFCIIIMKLMLELLLGWLLVNWYIKVDNKIMKNFIFHFFTKPVRFPVETANKVFHSIYYGNNSNLFIEFMDAFQDNYKNNLHSPKCDKNCLYCNEYSFESFQSQYFGIKQKFKRTQKNCTQPLFIKNTFPLIYKMLENLVRQNYEKQKLRKGDRYINSLFLLVLFYLFFEENYYKSLFYIKHLTETTTYYKNCFFNIQINLLRHYICSEYKKQALEIEGNHYKNIPNMSKSKINLIILMHKRYKSIEKIMNTENYFRKTIEAYNKLLSNFVSEDIPYRTFVNTVKQFKQLFELTELSLPIIINGEECLVPYSSSKINLFYDFFTGNQPSSITDYETFFSKSSLLSKEQNPYSVLVISFHNQKDKTIFKIDYASDELITLLKYSNEELKNMQFGDLLPKTFICPYSYLFEQAITEGDDTIKISNFCLVDKERYVMMFNLYGVTIFSQNTLKIFAKVEQTTEQMIIDLNNSKNKKKKDGKSKHKTSIDNIGNFCFLFTNKKGKIVSICRDFESIFYLTSKIIKKYQINIKDILRVEQLNKEGAIERDLSVIYENIMNNNICKAGSIGEDDFSKQVDGIREIHQILKVQETSVKVFANYQEKLMLKGKGVYKKYYLFIISLEDYKLVDTSLFPLMKESNMILKKNYLYKPTPISNYSTQQVSSSESFKELLFLIRRFSYKYLYLQYGIKKSQDKKENKQNRDYIDTLLKEKGFSNNTTNKMGTDDLTKKLENKKTSSSIRLRNFNQNVFSYPDQKMKYIPKFPSIEYWQKVVTYIVPVVFYILLVILSILKANSVSLQRDLFYVNGNFLLLRNTFSEILSTVLYMLFQSNGLQYDKIDNDYFNNSYQYYKSRIKVLLSDFIVFHEYSQNFIYQNENDLDTLYQDLLRTPFNITIMGMDYGKTTTESVFLNEHYMTIFLREIVESVPIKLYFNESYQTYVNESINFYAEATYVRLIENQLTIIKSIYIEFMNAFPEKLVQIWTKKQLIISIAITFVSGILLLYGIITFSYNLTHMQYLFAKYFISFVELRYFHLYLLSKTHLVLEFFINNGDNRNIKGLCQEIAISSYQQENTILKKNLSEVSDNLDLVRVKAFHLKTIELRREFTSSSFSRKEIFNQSSRFGVPTSQRSSNSGTKSLISRHKKRRESIKDSFKSIPQIKISKKDTYGNIPNNVSTTKGGSSITSSNVNMLSVASNSQSLFFNTTNNQNGKRLLKKPIEYIIKFALLLSLLIIFFSVNIINLIATYSNIEFIKIILETESIIFNNINFQSELLLTYQISILKNEEITFDYRSHGYLNNCDKTIEVNNQLNHNLFEEISGCYYSYKKYMQNAFDYRSFDYGFETIKEYIHSTETDGFCERYASFDKENSELIGKISKANQSNNTYESIVGECRIIGSGLNSKGISTALDSMYISLTNLYQDFKNDLNRTSECNMQRLNDKNIQSFQIEMLRLLFKLPIHYYISFQKDFELFDITTKSYELIIIGIQVVILISIAIFSLVILIDYSNEEKNVNFLERCIINTILF